MRPLLAFLLLPLLGCQTTQQWVRWQAQPPLAVVPLELDRAAVVAVDRECKPVADALALRLSQDHGVEVDPTADVRLHLYACGQVEKPLVVEVKADNAGEQRRVKADIRAHAALAVLTARDRRPRATLVGSSRRTAQLDGSRPSLLQLRLQARSELSRAVAQDLAHQLAPLPTLIARRTYPRAEQGTPEALHNLAVAAEWRGDLEEAFRLAQLAVEAAPENERHAAYATALESRLLLGLTAE